MLLVIANNAYGAGNCFLANPQSDPSQPAEIIARDIFTIRLCVDMFRD